MRSLNGFKIVFFIAQVDIQDMPMELGAQDNCELRNEDKQFVFHNPVTFSEINAFRRYELYVYWSVFDIFFGVCRYANLWLELRPMTFMENDHNITPRIMILPITINVIAVTGFRPRSNLLNAFDAGWIMMIMMDHLTTKRYDRKLCFSVWNVSLKWHDFVFSLTEFGGWNMSNDWNFSILASFFIWFSKLEK